MSWVVVISVLVMIILSLARVHVIIAILAAGLVAGLMSGLTLVESMNLLIEGMGGQAKTALSYILLGAFAVAISYTGITNVLVRYLVRVLTGKRTMIVLAIAAIASLSQNVVPVHIAFIPILIPPLLKLFNQMQVDRRAIATALTFGLKAPYIMIPAGYGLLFHETIVEGMRTNGMMISMNQVNLSLLIPGSGMIIGLFIAVFITYRKPVKQPINDLENEIEEENNIITFNRDHLLTILAIIGALTVQLVTGNLILGALTGLVLMFVFLVIPFNQGDKVITEGVTMMGTIAFVMLIASGFGHILEETEAITALIDASSGFLSSNKALIAFVLLSVGLVITMGIGSSFGTIPIIAALYVPICIATGFSPLATAALIGTSGALGDAGSPASESTLGPTSGLNADGRHHHIWDTCVPTFLHFNIPLFIFGWIAALIL
ncbi:Na+/H+ antiporter family protein [Paraliobacillus sp. PM-2]|uniref:Na+/H+ antiporter family protein n=1 Tax=Paraliobacillus sp. PM-2 TaxID=1462524 RepID=UPI00061C4CCB|nr:Na+/H+ antiporter NhaC family protein [Paraliobacillus sp. PM-2]CQR47269.1 Na+/H+ antiporter family protein [Paraliobacillus sp. PM-2]